VIARSLHPLPTLSRLVLPQGIAGTQQVLEFLANEISLDTYLNLMDQYRPCYRANQYPEIDRPITTDEYRAALETTARLGLTRLDRRRTRVPAPW
jgi:putative pyruvate formate lyase activating enzyme